MRQAESRDAWRRLLQRDRRFGLHRLEVTGKRPLADTSVDLPNGMTVVCGLNGVGKTTLLRLVEGALDGPEAIAARVRPELMSEGDFQLRIRRDADERTLSLGDVNGAAPLLIDVFELAPNSRGDGATELR